MLIFCQKCFGNTNILGHWNRSNISEDPNIFLWLCRRGANTGFGKDFGSYNALCFCSAIQDKVPVILLQIGVTSNGGLN